MKKISAFLLCVVISVCAMYCVRADDTTMTINGKTISYTAYNIEGNNYFRLRDLAFFLADTDAEFDVLWNEDDSSVKIITDCPYSGTTPEATEKPDGPVEISTPSTAIYLNSKRVSAKAFNIEGYTYFKLRDIAKLIDFGVFWSADEGIKIDTTRGYALTEDEEKNLYIEYAHRRHPEFVKQNEGWNEDKKYYNFADLDHDGRNELAVKKSAGITLYKAIDGEVQRMYCDPLPESMGETQYHYVTYNSEDCVAYITEERIILNMLSGNSLLPLAELKPDEIDKITFPERYTLEELTAIF